jgi:hypothetical protein
VYSAPEESGTGATGSVSQLSIKRNVFVRGGGGKVITTSASDNLVLPFAASDSSAARGAFTDLGHEELFGHPQFQAIWVHHYLEGRSQGRWMTESMEAAIQECQKLNVNVPPQFYAAKRDIETMDNAEYQRRYRRAPL